MATLPGITTAAVALKTVAIVEDDVRTRQLVKELLDDAEGFTCIAEYSSTEAALKALPTLAPDLALIDINLPGASGIACVRHLKPKLPATHFIVLTVQDDTDVIVEALSAGAVGFILKRAITVELEAALREVMLGGSPMSNAVARKVVRTFQTPRAPAPEISQLSERERQVLVQLARGQFYKEIADDLAIAQNTVHSYIRRIYEKLQVRSRMAAVAKLGPVPPPSGGSRESDFSR